MDYIRFFLRPESLLQRDSAVRIAFPSMHKRCNLPWLWLWCHFKIISRSYNVEEKPEALTPERERTWAHSLEESLFLAQWCGSTCINNRSLLPLSNEAASIAVLCLWATMEQYTAFEVYAHGAYKSCQLELIHQWWGHHDLTRCS